MRHAFAGLFAFFIATVPLSAQTVRPPDEDNCRTAINQGLDMLRRTPPAATPRDEEDRKRLLAEMERLVETARRQGLGECQTWARLMGKAFNQ